MSDNEDEQTDSPPPAEVVEKKVRCYVGNLDWGVESHDLEEHMKTAGKVVSAEVMRAGDGRSKGCAIVEFSTPEEAQEAISTLTDTEVKGRMIFVREDREIGSGGGRGGRGGRGRGGRGGRGGYGGRGRGRNVRVEDEGDESVDDDDDDDDDDEGGNTGSCSLYVGNLAYETSWQDLKDHMRAAGNVDTAKIITGQSDGRSKGCGIVVYQRPQDAARAIRELQNSELDGRPIYIREDREQGGRRGAGGAAGTQLYVGNLSFDTTWKELKDHFRQCGDVMRAEVAEGNNGRKKGYGTVQFFKKEDADNAIESLNGIELQGRALTVRLDHKAN